MADFTTQHGGTFDLVAATPRKIIFGLVADATAHRRGTLFNAGPAEVIIALGKPAADAWNRTEEVDKVPVPAGTPIRIPRRCQYIVCEAIGGAAKCWYVED